MNRRHLLLGLGAAGLGASVQLPPSASALARTAPVDLSWYGFERRTLTTPDGDISVFEAGSGDPLLLLHGVGAGASSFLWFRLAPLLARRYRVIAPDLIGWGVSDRSARPILFDDYVRQLGAIGAWVGRPMRVAVQSLGCGFALAAMRDGLLEVEQIALHGPSGGMDFGEDAFGPGATQGIRRATATPEAAERFYASFVQGPTIENWYAQVGFLDSTAVPQELIDNSRYGAGRPGSRFSALPFLTGDLRYDIAPLLREVDVPALAIWGAGEIQINASTRQRLRAVNPAIPTVEIEGARSCFEIEQPDAAHAELIRFFSG